MSKIRVLVVDDSALMRKVISEILNSSKDIEVVGTAVNGVDALRKLQTLPVDVVTLDFEMPEMDGLTTLKHIMSENPKPVVMISAYTKIGCEATIKSLEAGAADFVTKPDGSISLKIRESADEIIKKVLAASKVNIGLLRKTASQEIEEQVKTIKAETKELEYIDRGKIVVIGSSTGGPQTLERVIPYLPKNIPAPIIIVQHMPPSFTKSLAERLNRLSNIPVKEAEEGDILEKGKAYIAPGDYHLEIRRGLFNGQNVDKITLNQKPKEEGVRPSVNVTLRSAAELYKEKVVAVILTGMGSDGTDGMKKVKYENGVCIAQDKDTSIIYGMPKAVADAGLADYILPLDQIPAKIISCVSS